MAELWEKQKGESRKAYQAFSIYRDMGPARSLSKVSQQLHKSKTLLGRWSERWSWVARAEAWDDELDRRAREAQEQARLEMVDRHARAAVAFQARVLERLRELDPSDLSPLDMVRWFDVAVKVERLSRGEPTEIGKQEVTLPPILEVELDHAPERAGEGAGGEAGDGDGVD